MVVGLLPFADQVQHPIAAQCVGVVLDAHGRGLGGSERVDTVQVGQGPVVHADGPRDLKEADQLESVQALGAGLVAVRLRQPGVDRWVGRDGPVDVSEPEEPADRVHHRVHRRPSALQMRSPAILGIAEQMGARLIRNSMGMRWGSASTQVLG
jgi:hypothetical protein